MASDLSQTSFNTLSYNRDNPMLIDVVSSTLIYVGTSEISKETTKPIWRIKKIWQDSSIWKFDFPNGSQEFVFIWEDRGTYTYA